MGNEARGIDPQARLKAVVHNATYYTGQCLAAQCGPQVKYLYIVWDTNETMIGRSDGEALVGAKVEKREAMRVLWRALWKTWRG